MRTHLKYLMLPAVLIFLVSGILFWYTGCGRVNKITKELEEAYGEEFIIVDDWTQWGSTSVDVPPTFHTYAICAPASDPELVFRFEVGYRKNNGWRYYYALAERELCPILEEKAEAYFGDCTVMTYLSLPRTDPESKAEATREQLLALAAEEELVCVDYTLFVNTDSYQGTDYQEEFQEITRMRSEIEALGIDCDIYVYFMPEESISEYIRIFQYSHDRAEELAPIKEKYEEIPFSDYGSAYQTEENYISKRTGYGE